MEWSDLCLKRMCDGAINDFDVDNHFDNPSEAVMVSKYPAKWELETLPSQASQAGSTLYP